MPDPCPQLYLSTHTPQGADAPTWTVICYGGPLMASTADHNRALRVYREACPKVPGAAEAFPYVWLGDTGQWATWDELFPAVEISENLLTPIV